MKDKKLLFGIVLIFIFVFSVGLTYAYFNTSTTGEGNNISSSVGTLNILYTDGVEIVASGIKPGWTTTKTIKVENTGSLKAFYSIAWASLTNEIMNDELILSATCTSDTGVCDNVLSTPVTNDKIVSRQGINPGEEQTYTITFEFIETSSTQNYNQGKRFTGVLNVIDENESFTVAGTLLDINGNPVAGGYVEIHSEVRTGTTDANGKFEIEDVEVGTHEIIFKNSSNEVIATDTIKLVSSNNEKAIENNITADTNQGYINLKIELNNTSSIGEIIVIPTLKTKILSDNTVYADNVSSTYVSSGSGINFQAKSTLTNGQGLYTNNKYEDGKNTYFRGGSFCAYTDYSLEDYSTGSKCTAAGGTWDGTKYICNLNSSRSTCESKGFTYYDLKNNVTFAGKKWKIIRIDENGNIRMILAEDSIGTTSFNTYYNDNAYVGYMFGDKTLFQEGTTSTTASRYIGTSSTYYYSTGYAINASYQFYLTGTMISGKWDTSGICTTSSCPVANYYTCSSTSSSGTCSILYKISSWNSSNYANTYKVEMLSQSYALAHANITNSAAKTAVDNWYNANLTSYSNYLADSGYCNDRSIDVGLGYGSNDTDYKPMKRNFLNTPLGPRISLSQGCSNSSRDLFTTSSNPIGNKTLTNPIGLITADEAAYAGMVYKGTAPAVCNFVNYLKFNTDYWTMGPGGDGTEYRVHTFGSFYADIVSNTAGIRVSISLKPTTIAASGTGTYDDPYVIE